MFSIAQHNLPSDHIPWWQLQQTPPGSILVCDIPKQLKFDNMSNLNVYVVLCDGQRSQHHCEQSELQHFFVMLRS